MRLTRTIAAAAALTLAPLAALAQTPPAAQAPQKVKLGVLADLSGLYSDIGGAGAIDAVNMAIEDFQPAKKGLAVEVVSADSQNKPDTSVSIVRRWFEAEGVDAIFDIPTSGIAMALQSLVKEKNKAMFVTAAATSELSGKACTPNTAHWTYDTWALSRGTADAIVRSGGKSWFFLTADYTFGHTLEKEASEVVTANGGKVVGAVRHPLDSKDFSSFLLQAQGSKAQIIGLANGGHDTINSIKTAAEFGVVAGGQKLAGMLLFISDVHSLGLKAANGLMLTNGFYWDSNDRTRAFGERFYKRNGKMPSMTQAGAYSATLAYLGAVAKGASPADGAGVLAAIRKTGTWDDPVFGKSALRVDGRMVHDMNLVEVKKPEESKRPYDYYKVLAVIPGDKAFRPLAESPCPLAKP